MAQAPHKPTELTRVRVYSLAQVKVPHQHIAVLIGISEKTLRRHYKAELKKGEADYAAELRNALYQETIIKRIPTMLIFAAKTQLRDSEPRPVEEKSLEQKKPQEVRIIGGLPE